jgi:hypothetical protein
MKKDAFHLAAGDAVVTMTAPYGWPTDAPTDYPLHRVGAIEAVSHSGWYVDYFVNFGEDEDGFELVCWVGAECVAHIPA